MHPTVRKVCPIKKGHEHGLGHIYKWVLSPKVTDDNDNALKLKFKKVPKSPSEKTHNENLLFLKALAARSSDNQPPVVTIAKPQPFFKRSLDFPPPPKKK